MSRSESLQISRLRILVFSLFATTSGLLLIFCCAEFGLRISHGALTSLEPRTRTADNTDGGAGYHSTLGWLPTIDVEPGVERSRLHLAHALRPNGETGASIEGPLTLAAGDSFTWGHEVSGVDSWPAHLERNLKTAVLNAGVPSYGAGQVVLRAESLLDVLPVEQLIVALISHDVNRTEHSYYQGWKPYFYMVGSECRVANTPVPKPETLPPFRFALARKYLSYSFLANAIFRRLTPDWWAGTMGRKVHGDGLETAVCALRRLARSSRRREIPMLVVVLGVQRVAGNHYVDPLTAALRNAGIDTLDLATPLRDVLAADPAADARLFMKFGHYTSAGNRWVAEQIGRWVTEHWTRTATRSSDAGSASDR